MMLCPVLETVFKPARCSIIIPKALHVCNQRTISCIESFWKSSFLLLFIVSSHHNILKFFFIATQSVLLLRNDPFMIILGFGLSQTDIARKLEISWETLSWLLIIYVFFVFFLGWQFFESRGSCLNDKASLILCWEDVQWHLNCQANACSRKYTENTSNGFPNKLSRNLRGQGQNTSVPLHFVLLRKVYHTLLYSANRQRTVSKGGVCRCGGYTCFKHWIWTSEDLIEDITHQ